jgi:hypothetical protein
MSLRLSIVATAITLVVTARPALSLDPTDRITQYRHAAWRVQKGAFESAAKLDDRCERVSVDFVAERTRSLEES